MSLSCLLSHNFVKLSDRLSQCTKCGKAKELPCEHVFKDTRSFQLYDSDMWGQESAKCTVIVKSCEKCGEVKEFYPEFIRKMYRLDY